MRPELEKKIQSAIKLLQVISRHYDNQVIEVAYSGGKDSDVILQLTKESGIPYRAIYKNTTIDPPKTIAHVKSKGVEIVNPKKSFFQLVADNGFPSRKMRYCCRELKEYKILDKVILGVRQAESRKRKERYTEPTRCRVYSKKEETEQILPIRDWADEDVAEYIADRKIQCHPLYYDEQGDFHVERRLGCVGCPLQSRKKRIQAFIENPRFLKAWIIAGQKYWNKRGIELAETHEYKNIYEYMYFSIFYDTQSEMREDKYNLFDKIDCKKRLEDKFKIKL